MPADEYAPIADLYDHVVPYRTREDVAFLVEAAKESGGPVLEIGCGTGRILLPTARAGIEIDGLDASSAMLAVCKQRLQAEPEDVQSRVQLTHGDMRSFDLGRRYRLVTVPFRPFQHLLTVEDQIACLACVRRHLEPAGRFILDLFNPMIEALAGGDLGQETGHEPEFTTPDGRRVVRCHKILSRDHLNQVSQVELIHYIQHPGGRQERLVHAFPMRHLFRFEAEHLLERCGFEVEALYADYNRAPYGSKYPGELIFIARPNLR